MLLTIQPVEGPVGDLIYIEKRSPGITNCVVDTLLILDRINAMLRMLEAQAPAKQTATETISTLSSRLNNATLLEDRRAAILGLRSFAKEYPASVASGSLRGLISSLAKDLEDVDTIKVVLETLLMLFKPNATSPEAGEEIALWLADEFSQRQDNIKTLLDLLETNDFYSRLYSLQLLTAIFASRPERTQECILNAALGTSRLVATLDDPREPVRNAGLVFLGDLTQSSTELQKLVAFEGTFDRIFTLLKQAGGLQEGGIIVQDCLDLLANLVRQNSSNQSLFRESGCVPKLSDLLRRAYVPIEPMEGETDALDDFPNPQRDKNLWGLLAVIRLFLVSGSVGSHLNQKTFEKHGLLQSVLDLAFREATDAPIRAEALYTCADMIRGNADLQAGFAQLQVPITEDSSYKDQPNGTTNGLARIYVIDALLDLVIASGSAAFNIRLAACECIKAYFTGHTPIRLHFLNRAIEGYTSGEDETANALATLIRDGASHQSDPYKIWFSAVLLLHLIWDDSEAKSTLMKVSEGDAVNGEEVITCIQTIAGNLVAGLQRDDDERILIAYLMLLCSFLYEAPEAVNDFLDEASHLQALVQIISTNAPNTVLVSGLSALLIGILYEYSTKDSPIPRRKLQPLLTTSLGREKYLQALNQLRQNPLVRDYEVFEQASLAPSTSSGLPPYAFFDATFIDFLKDKFSRFSRAIDRDPGIEIHVGSQENGVDRDLVDSLRSQIDEKSKTIEKHESHVLELEQKLDQALANHRKELETAQADLQRIKQIHESLQTTHDAEVAKLQNKHSVNVNGIQSSLSQQIQDLQAQVVAIRKQTSDEAERTKDYYERSLSQARTGKTNMEARLAAANKTIDESKKAHDEALKTIAELQDENKSWKRAIDSQKNAAEKKDKQLKELQSKSEKQVEELKKKSDSQLEELQKKLDKQSGEASSKSEKKFNDLKQKTDKQLKDLNEALKSQKETAEDEKTKVAMLEKEVSELETAAKGHQKKLNKAEKEAKGHEEAKGKVQAELDDLFLMLQDLEEKRTKDKKRLKALGEEVSDIDDDDDEDDEDEDEVD